MNSTTPSQPMGQPNKDPNQQSINETIFQNIQSSMPPMPNNNMVLAIVGTIVGSCSCIGLIFGILAIVKSSQVSSKYAQGDFVGAEESSKNAKTYGLIALVLGIIGFIASIIYYIAIYAAVMNDGAY